MISEFVFVGGCFDPCFLVYFWILRMCWLSIACFVRSTLQVCSLNESFVVLDSGEGEVRGK